MERFNSKTTRKDRRSIAYFSMEIGIDEKIPTYSGGLGILAGDTIKSCADLNVPVVAITLLYRKGYFQQKLDAQGNQTEQGVEWKPEDFLKRLDKTITVNIEGRQVHIAAWQYDVKGADDYSVPLIYLDTDLEENNEADRRITHHLYGGDQRYRLQQEIVLGIGGIRTIENLGYRNIQKYHMNEGHSSLLVLELLRKNSINSEMLNLKNKNCIRERCVFTTHTPVPAGHDQYDFNLVKEVVGDIIPFNELETKCHNGKLNMTYLALDNSQYINGVAKKHGEVSRDMFPGYLIDSITNGVHSVTWTSKHFSRLYDKYIPGWKNDSFTLRYALNIPGDDIWNAHIKAKKDLFDYIKKTTGTEMKPEVFTIGFARRSTAYKRADLLFSSIERLKKIAKDVGEIQIIYGGKAHPNDGAGKDLIRNIFKDMEDLKGKIRCVYLENYDIEIAKKMVSGVDIWLNTPLRPLEASGTSGMKACHNGIPNLSIPDGWWLEGHLEDITGWSIGDKNPDNSRCDDAKDLYDKLEHQILPKYYKDRKAWTNIMKHSIAFNASFFNTHRMIHQYVLNAYFR
ncbi:MAG: alpha-glucan family phosphorylase [Candidatus Aenigmarchaeota archaeon]|nr:alpha-glucan family phosphorylase [Candidatus Aenigmarchaeota archaeon]